MRKDLGSKFAAILIIAICGYALLHLLLMRYNAGDVYPEYSSMRTDPFGTKAFYESLQQCCGLKVSRNFDDFNLIKNKYSSAIIFAGSEVPPDEIPLTFFNELDSFMKNGGRLIVTYVPSGRIEKVLKEIEEENKKQQKEKEAKEKKKKKDEPKSREEELFRTVKLSEKWGLRYAETDSDSIGVAHLIPKTRLPKVLTWHSPVYFDLEGENWNVIYNREGRAVVTQRQFGKGSLVLVADSFMLSNEAMLRDRQPEFLAWLIGDKREIIFDEFHHGIAASPGVAALARKYHLHGVAAGLLIMALLFIWMNSTSLVPQYESAAEVEKKTIFGKDSASGLSNLLRRSVSVKDIFSLCFREWKKSAGKEKLSMDQRVRKAEAYLSEISDETNRVKDPVASYNHISQILRER